MVSFFAKSLFENIFLSKKRVSLEPTSNHQHSVFPKTDELLICNEIKEKFFLRIIIWLCKIVNWK